MRRVAFSAMCRSNHPAPLFSTLPFVACFVFGSAVGLFGTARALQANFSNPQHRNQMGFKIVTLLVLVLGALVSAQGGCARSLSNWELQRKVRSAHHAKYADELLAQSAKVSAVIHGSLGAQLAKEEAGASAGAGGLQHLELTPHGAELVPAELVEAEHVSNGPWTTPSSTTAEVDYNKPFDFNNSGGDPRVQEVSLGST